ncbi:MAG: hypothetical protein V4719_15285 [Planctomycetota bacterium]
MLRLCSLCLAVLWSAQIFGAEIAAELNYPTDQPLMAIRTAQLRSEDREVVTIHASTVIHIDWDDGEQLLTTIEGRRFFILKEDLRPIKQAVESFTQQLLLDAKDPWLYQYRSQAYSLLGRTGDALSDTETAQKLMPMDTTLAMFNGLKVGNHGNWVAAWQAAEVLQMFSPYYARGYLLSAMAAMNLGANDAAEDYLWAAFELAPDDVDIQRCLAMVLSQKAQTPEDWTIVLNVLNDILRLHPHDYESLEFRTQAHRKLEHVVEAKADGAARRRLCDSWLRACPENAEFWTRRGKFHIEFGNMEAAFVDLSEAIRLDPLNVESRRNRAGIRVLRKDFRAALEDVTFITKLVPHDTEMQFQHAWLLVNCGEDRQAIAGLNEFLRMHPEHAEARGTRVDAAVKCQDWQAVETDFRFFLTATGATRPSNAKLAVLAMLMGDETQTLELLQGETEQSEDSRRCYRWLVRRALYRGDIKTAQSLLTQFDVRDQWSRVSQAMCLYLSGGFEEAYRELDEVYVQGTNYKPTEKKFSVVVTTNKGQFNESTKKVDINLDDKSSLPGPAAQSGAQGTKKPGETEELVESESNNTAQDARFLRNLFKIQRREIQPSFDRIVAGINMRPVLLRCAYVVVRVQGLDQQESFRNGPFAVKNGEFLLGCPETASYLRIPLYEAIAAGHAENGQFDEAVRWQRRILDETPRDHLRRVWYWEIHQRYLKQEKYPLGLVDPDLVTPMLHTYLNLEGEPGLLSPLPPPLPE